MHITAKLKSISKPLPTMHKISSLITIDDLNKALKKLLWHKAPERNGITLNVLKTLDKVNRLILLQFIN